MRFNFWPKRTVLHAKRQAKLDARYEVMAERIAFYRALFHRPQKGA